MSQSQSSPLQAAYLSIAKSGTRRTLRGLVPWVFASFLLIGSAGSAVAQSTDWTDSSASDEVPASGQFIADYAMQFLGSSYVSGGNGPGGFDCSGFTQFVLINTLGVDIGHDVAGQINSGSWVEWDEWQIGDLVFFAGTYRAGISHVGIYIGDGQFIHSENESTGVTISSLWSDYYSGHYYGAQRLV